MDSAVSQTSEGRRSHALCSVCGEHFTQRSIRHTACSTECGQEQKRLRVNLRRNDGDDGWRRRHDPCVVCGATYMPHIRKQATCSRECGVKRSNARKVDPDAATKLATLRCQMCGDSIPNARRKNVKWCSNRCASMNDYYNGNGQEIQKRRAAESSNLGKTFATTCTRCGELFSYEHVGSKRHVCDPCRKCDHEWHHYGLHHREVADIRSRACCDICGATENPGGRSREGVFHIDHDHSTGKVRGLLCAPCNTAIGLMGDNPERLITAAKYIKEHE